MYFALKERTNMTEKFLWCQNLCSFESKHICNTYLYYLSCCASFSCKSTKLIFQQQPVQQAIQTLHQQQYLWYLQCMISFRLFFSNDFITKNLPLYSCYGHETFGIQSELNLSSSHNYVSKFITYIELNRLQRVIISSLRKR